jgi:predicted AAA+ superfamily ATPase
MWIERIIKLPEKKHFFLFGPRQTGKSSLLKNRFESGDTLYYDLLKSELYRTLLARPEIFRNEVLAALQSTKPAYVIIDEVQRIPQLLNEVHFLVESGVPCSFILSGSSSRKLKRQRANMLAGRAWTYHLYPFSFMELQEKFNLLPALKYGTLPAVYLCDDEHEKSEILRSYVETYIKEEIEMEANIRNLGGFLRFLPVAAVQNGELVNFANIARECGVSSHLVREYYKILEDTLTGFFLLPYGRSIRKKLVKHPKFYFFDTGVVSALSNRLRIDFPENSFLFGNAFEHLIILEIIKLNHYHRLDLDLSFYRTERGSEVDCIIETPAGKTIALEIKSTTDPSSSMLKGLYSFKEKAADAQLILACRAQRPRLIKDVTVLPWQEAIRAIVSEA